MLWNTCTYGIMDIDNLGSNSRLLQLHFYLSFISLNFEAHEKASNSLNSSNKHWIILKPFYFYPTNIVIYYVYVMKYSHVVICWRLKIDFKKNPENASTFLSYDYCENV